MSYQHFFLLLLNPLRSTSTYSGMIKGTKANKKAKMKKVIFLCKYLNLPN